MDEIAYLQMRLEAAEKQRVEAIRLMQSVQPGIHSKAEEVRLQRLRDYAYTLQNRIDAAPNYNLDYTKARLSAICWAVTKITGQVFTTEPQNLEAERSEDSTVATKE